MPSTLRASKGVRNRMKTVLRNYLIAAFIGASAIFFIIAKLVPRLLLFDVVNPISAVLAIGLIVTVRRGVYAFFRSSNNAAGILWFCIALFGLYVAIRHGWNAAWRHLGNPTWMQDHILVAYLIFVSGFASVAGIAAYEDVEISGGRVPPRRWRRTVYLLLTAIVIGVIVSYVF